MPSGSTHAEHLGNSVSEVDPTYGLQNAFVVRDPFGNYSGDYDPFNILGSATSPPVVSAGTNTYTTSNTPGRTTPANPTLAGGRGNRRPPDPVPQPAGRHAPTANSLLKPDTDGPANQRR